MAGRKGQRKNKHLEDKRTEKINIALSEKDDNRVIEYAKNNKLVKSKAGHDLVIEGLNSKGY